MMVEPTETEGKEVLDSFADAMICIAKDAEGCPDQVTGAPREMPISRPDEVAAARNPILRWRRE